MYCKAATRFSKFLCRILGYIEGGGNNENAIMFYLSALLLVLFVSGVCKLRTSAFHALCKCFSTHKVQLKIIILDELACALGAFLLWVKHSKRRTRWLRFNIIFFSVCKGWLGLTLAMTHHEKDKEAPCILPQGKDKEK